MPGKRLDTERALELYKQGKYDKDIGEALGVHRKTVGIWRRSVGLPAYSTEGIPKGSKHSREIKREPKKKSKLVLDAYEAKKHNMTYGKWKAAGN